MSGVYIGFDIGGTKCAVVVGQDTGAQPRILARRTFPTPASQADALTRLCELASIESKKQTILGVGISAGNPMDAQNGMLLNPPNLPGWSGVSWTKWTSDALHAPAKMENDANACALAEWRWGAGQGYSDAVFLTFGTGLGAGLILNGALYRGKLGNAGEVGHWRLSEFGPCGYGKSGSFEGFCSGGGLTQLAKTIGLGFVQRGQIPSYWNEAKITAKTVAEAARAGDAAALEVFSLCGRMLGRGLALIVDILNPECIILGSIYERCLDLLHPAVENALKAEALGDSASACAVVPAELGEQIGDYAALLLAMDASEEV